MERRTSGMVALDAPGAALWEKTIAAWTDGGAHDRFVQYCHATGQLAAAGACYRARAATEPPDPVAKKMQERVVFLSMQALVPTSRARSRWAFFQSPWFVLLVLVGAALGAVLGFAWGGTR
jgi:hypothetical protein